MTDEELDSIASEVFDLALDRVRGWSTRYFYDVNERQAVLYGEPGNFRFAVFALPVVKKIIRECDALLDTFDVASGRDAFIKQLAEATATHFIGSLGSRVNDTISQAAVDCKVIAHALIVSTLNEAKPSSVSPDLRWLVSDAGERVAAEKEAFLRLHIGQLPHLTTQGPGRPAVTALARELEQQKYSEQIEGVYRRLRDQLRRKPKKIEVADALGAGGISFQTGRDTRLNTFNNKLKRLGIDYSSLIAQVDSETTS